MQDNLTGCTAQSAMLRSFFARCQVNSAIPSQQRAASKGVQMQSDVTRRNQLSSLSELPSQCNVPLPFLNRRLTSLLLRFQN